jgi:GNAT superfamily N-acetyltransferase
MYHVVAAARTDGRPEEETVLVEIAADDPEWRAALQAEGLPVDDLATARLRAFAWRYGNRPLAFAAVEGGGTDRLLRSVVVVPSARRRGLARHVAAEVAQKAREEGAERLWLLTTTAAQVFERLGWRRADRADAPPGAAASRQFAALCPASAVCMVRDIASEAP